MKTLSGSQITHVSGGLIVNPVTVKLAVAAGKAVGKGVVAAAGAAGTYGGYKATKNIINR